MWGRWREERWEETQTDTETVEVPVHCTAVVGASMEAEGVSTEVVEVRMAVVAAFTAVVEACMGAAGAWLVLGWEGPRSAVAVTEGPCRSA